MALWGNNDNVESSGTVSLNYTTRVVTGSGTSFGIAGGCSEGQVIRFGIRGGASSSVFFGDAVIVSIANSESLTVDSTAGLSGAAIAATSFYISELPKYTVLDHHWSQSHTDYDPLIYGISTADAENMAISGYEKTDAGWVGITTYNDTDGNFRVKRECLVAMSGITTGSNGIGYPTPEV
jgi:hypothetical protein